MLYREIIAVCFESQPTTLKIHCEQNAEFLTVKRGGTYSDHWAFKRLMASVF
jgi:hypothetical protein